MLETLKGCDLIKMSTKNETKNTASSNFDISQLSNTIHNLHNVCRDYEDEYNPLMAVDEITKLLYLKIKDDQSEGPSLFTVSKIKDDTQDSLKKIIGKYIANTSILPNGEDFDLSEESLVRMTRILEDINFSKIDADIKGVAYEELLSSIFRGSLGQYFTPRSIVKFMVKLVDPVFDKEKNKANKIIDPAVGTGGFLTYAASYYKNKYPNISDDVISDNLYGVDSTSRMTKIANINLNLTTQSENEINHIYQGNTLKMGENTIEVKDITGGDVEISFNQFDIVLTNPPFGSKEKKKTVEALTNNSTSVKDNTRLKIHKETEALFLKRCIELAKPEGDIGIILPKNVIKGKGFRDLQKWVLDNTKVKAVISLPTATFTPFGSDAKTVVLYLEKKNESSSGYNQTFFDAARYIGHDKSGNSIEKNDLNEILKQYRKRRTK